MNSKFQGIRDLRNRRAGSFAETLKTSFEPVVRGTIDTILSLTESRRQPEGGAFLAAAGATEIATLLNAKPLEYLAKPLIAPAALLVALRPGRLDNLDTALLGATAAGYTAGDVILMFPEDSRAAADRRLVRGATAFGVGHASLTALLLRNGVRMRAAPAAALLGPGALIALSLLTGDREDKALGVYSLVLSGTAAMAASAGFGEFEPVADGAVTAAEGDTAARQSLGFGAGAFVLSDLIILLTRNVAPGSIGGRLARMTLIDLYSSATLTLLAGAAALSRAGGAR